MPAQHGVSTQESVDGSTRVDIGSPPTQECFAPSRSLCSPSMALAPAARQRLAESLRAPHAVLRPLRGFHTLPIGQWAWDQHSAVLVSALEDLAGSARPCTDDFNSTREWVAQLLNKRSLAISHLLALEPFTPFETPRADATFGAVATVLEAAARSVEAATTFDPPTQEILKIAAWWRTRETGTNGVESLRDAFMMPEAPADEYGEFRPDWVLQHYAYRGHELLRHLLPHLAALGLPGVTDVLAAVSIVGFVLNCDDPITAYVEMDSFFNRYLGADPDVASKVRAHLEACEPALRRARRAANRAWVTAATDSLDIETRALALVDAYTPLLEGPFRQLSWALYCLRKGTWDSPPMLTSLREKLVAEGGNLKLIASNAIIPSLRNSDTHQTLEWDGYAEAFVTEVARISPSEVATAITAADCYVHGWEAGLAAARTLDARPNDNPLPLPSEPGRIL